MKLAIQKFVMKPILHIRHDKFEIKKFNWPIGKILIEDVKFDNVGFGFFSQKMDSRINNFLIHPEPYQVGIVNTNVNNEIGINLTAESNQMLGATFLRFDKNIVYDKILKFVDNQNNDLVTIADVEKMIADPSFVSFMDGYISRNLIFYFGQLSDIMSEDRKLLRERLVDLLIEQIFLTVIRSSARSILDSFVRNFSISHPLALLTNKIDQNIHLNWNISDMSRVCGISEATLFRYFKKYIGISPQGYIFSKKIQASQKLLRNAKHMNISEIGYSVGFKDVSYFSRAFKSKTGYSPRSFRDQNVKEG
jgi:AraC-like DNA-binding protein